MNTSIPTAERSRRGIRAVPFWVWLCGLAGAVLGVFLAEPGDFVGNTIPGTLTFLVAGLVVGFVAWGIVVGVGRRRA